MTKIRPTDRLIQMAFCENIGEQVIIKGQYINRKAFICIAGVGQEVLTTDGRSVKICPFSTIFSARGCGSYKPTEVPAESEVEQ